MKLVDLFRYITKYQDVQLIVLLNNAIPRVVTGVTYLQDSANGLDAYADYTVAGINTEVAEDGDSYLAIYLKDVTFEGVM